MRYVQFDMRVVFGNDAMQTREDLKQALNDVIKHITTCECSDGKIRDSNGNTVGEWSLTTKEVR